MFNTMQGNVFCDAAASKMTNIGDGGDFVFRSSKKILFVMS